MLCCSYVCCIAAFCTMVNCALQHLLECMSGFVWMSHGDPVPASPGMDFAVPYSPAERQ